VEQRKKASMTGANKGGAGFPVAKEWRGTGKVLGAGVPGGATGAKRTREDPLKGEGTATKNLRADLSRFEMRTERRPKRTERLQEKNNHCVSEKGRGV